MILTWPPGAVSAWRRNWSGLRTTSFTLARAALAKVAERIQGMDAKELAAGQIPSALKTLFELELKAQGHEDRVALTGKDGGPVKVDTKTQHVFSAVAGIVGRDTAEAC